MIHVDKITYFQQYSKYIVADGNDGKKVEESDVSEVNKSGGDIVSLTLEDGTVYTTEERDYKCMCHNKEVCRRSGCCLNRKETGRSFGI